MALTFLKLFLRKNKIFDKVIFVLYTIKENNRQVVAFIQIKTKTVIVFLCLLRIVKNEGICYNPIC